MFNDFSDDRLEYRLKRFIIQSLIKWKINSMINSLIFSNILNMARSWKIILEFMERTSHHSISQVKCFLHSIPVMNININIQHPLVSFKQLQNSKHTVIDIAESTGLRLFGMVQTTRPINAISVFTLSQQSSSSYGTCSITHTIVIESFHHRAVFLEIKSIKLVFIVIAVLRSDSTNQIDVLVGMESCKAILVSMVAVELSELQVLSKGSVRWSRSAAQGRICGRSSLSWPLAEVSWDERRHNGKFQSSHRSNTPHLSLGQLAFNLYTSIPPKPHYISVMTDPDEDFDEFQSASEPVFAPLSSDPPQHNSIPHISLPDSPNLPIYTQYSTHFSTLSNQGSAPSLEIDLGTMNEFEGLALGKMESQHIPTTPSQPADFQSPKSNQEHPTDPYDFLTNMPVNPIIQDLNQEQKPTTIIHTETNSTFTNTQKKQSYQDILPQQQQPQHLGEYQSMNWDFGGLETYQKQENTVNQPQKVQIAEEEDQFNDYYQAQPEQRKESEQFVFQTETLPVPEAQPQSQHTVETQPTLTSQHVIPNSQPIIEESQLVIETGFLSTGNVPEDQSHKDSQQFVFEEASQPPKQVFAEPQDLPLRQETVKVVQDQDDDFGEFEEQKIPQKKEKEELKQKGIPQLEGDQNVRIDQAAVPMGMEVKSREAELRAFVEGLPDYSFLLSQAFVGL